MTPKEYDMALLEQLRKKYGRKEKDNFKLEKISAELLGKKIPTTPWDTYVPNSAYAIINTDSSKQSGTHWLGVAKRGKNIYVYDSFGRYVKNVVPGFVKKMSGLGYNIVDRDHGKDQGEKQEDCGLRSLTWLIAVKKLGLKKALTI